MALAIKTIEISDFSGGITENALQGPTNKSYKIENFFITVDHKLQMRPGIVINDLNNPVLQSANNSRVGDMFTFINETILMGRNDRNIYYQNVNSSAAWTAIQGFGTGEALQGGTHRSQINYSEFQRQIYFAGDDGPGGRGIKPSKIYRNSSNTWVAKTAGLPRSWSQGPYNQTSLLAACCNLANNLKSCMMSHMSDYGSGTFAMHQAFDSTDYNLLNAAANAVDQASLFNLVGVLNTAFVAHSQDANSQVLRGTFTTTPPVYHWNTAQVSNLGTTFWAGGTFGYTPAKGPNIIPANTSTPSVQGQNNTANQITALQTAAAQLDNLYTAYNWHRLGFLNHSFTNDYSVMNRYGPSVSKIGRYSIGNTYPTITPDWTDFINYVNTIAALLQLHLSNNNITLLSAHSQPVPQMYQVNIPNATDLDSAFLLIYWMRSVYDLHINDALTSAYTNITFTGNATTSLSAVDTSAGAVTLPVGSYIFSTGSGIGAFVGNGISGNFVAQVVSSGSGTAVLDRVAKTGSGVAGQYSLSHFHVNTGQNVTAGSTLTSTTSSPVGSSEQLATSNTSIGNYLSGNSNTQQFDINSWITLSQELLLCLAQHNFQTNSHNAQAPLWATLFASTLKNFIVPSASTVSYAFYLSDNYQVENNGIYYQANSNPIFSDSIQVAVSYPQNYVIPTTNSLLFPAATVTTTRYNTISNIYNLINTNETNYDTTNANINIYRTVNTGQVFYQVTQQANGVTTYADGTNDTITSNNVTALNTNTQIYTNGGIVGYDDPPIAKYCEIVNGVVYWGWITDTGQDFPQRVRQGVQFAPDAAPSNFYNDLEDEITGMGRARSNLVVFCKNSIYRMGGGFSPQGQGALIHERISDAIGCINSKSIVKTEVGLFFAGSDGFYYTDGFQIIKISLEIDKTYLAFTSTPQQKVGIYGAYDRLTRRVWWAVREDQTALENNVAYVFYLDYGIKPSGSFTTVRNPSNFSPSSMAFVNGVLYIGDSRGYVLRMDSKTKWDHTITPGTSPSLWQWQSVPYNWTSCAIDCGTTGKRKYFTKVHLVGNNSGNVAAQINSIRDLQNDQPFAMRPINYQENKTWGSATDVWGKSTDVWAYKSKMDLWRRFNSNSSRSDFMQFQFTPVKNLAVYASGNVGMSQNFPVDAYATVNATTKTATLVTPTGYSSIIWPRDVVGYTVSFQTDNYVNAYLITAVSGNQITYSDASGTSASGTWPWVVRGQKKEQAPTITSFTAYYTELGEKFQKYPGKSIASGAGNMGENPS